jgi:galactose-1-phosphate uridylyltransferase
VIEFKKIIQKNVYLNPFSQFALREGMVEIRWDPLTQITSRIVHFPARKFERFDFEETIKTSLNVRCPFCPENVNDMTSKFDKGVFGFERFEAGDVMVIPNILTFDKYCLVAIISKEHFVDMDGLIEGDYFYNGLTALLRVLRIIREKDKDVRYFSINCNYMPMSGSSILHPHIQAIAGEYPTNYHGMMVQKSEGYRDRTKQVYWDELISEEINLKERFIKELGKTHWYVPFAPRGNGDIGCIFEKSSLFELVDADIRDFCAGLMKVLTYFKQENVSGFNLSVFSGIEGGDYFRANARIVARRFLPPVNAADSNYFDKLHMESACLYLPEDVSNKLKKVWENS